MDDFEINARGTLNVLEAARASGSAVFFTSTNKVYGGMDDVPVVELATRYAYADLPTGGVFISSLGSCGARGVAHLCVR